MNKSSTTGLWAVRWVHESGYQASIYHVVEAERRLGYTQREVAIEKANEINCRLRDFKCWSWKIEKLPYSKNENGKWFPNSGNPSFKDDIYKKR